MRLCCCAPIAFAVSCLFAQENTLRTTVPIVVLPVTVTDRNGHFVYGIPPTDFLVSDDGKPRPVHVDDPDSGLAPPRLVILIQTSDISDSALLKIRKTGAMVQQAVLGANGEAAIISFSDIVTVLQDFTSNADEISTAFHNLKTAESDGGKMIDAVAKALDMLSSHSTSNPPAVSSILIIGENKDRGSKTKLSDLISKIEHSPVTIDTLVYSVYLTAFTTKGSEYSPPDSGGLIKAITETARLGKKNTAAALTAATGGQSFRFETQSKLENNLIHLGSEIHSRYLVSFTPDQQQNPSFHSIEVKIKGRPQLNIRTRPGYWSDFKPE